MSPHLPAPISQSYFRLDPAAPDIPVFFFNPFYPVSPLIPSAHVGLGLSRFLLPGGLHFIILRCVIPVVCRKTNGEVNISNEITTRVVWIYAIV